MIYVKVDVEFLDHPKALAVGHAGVGMWLMGLAYSRKHELDGKIPKAAVLAFQGSKRRNKAVVQSLVDVGLWIDIGDHFLVFNYEQKGNQTKAEISESRREARDRMGRVRANKRRTNGEQTAKFAKCSPIVPISDLSLSDLGFDLGSRSDPLAAPPDQTRTHASEREQAYQAAYERGIHAGKGSPYAMPEGQRGALHQAMRGHGKHPESGKYFRGEQLLGWIAFEAEQFARWLAAQPKTELKFWSSYGPSGWLRWMNQEPVAPPALKSPATAKLVAAIGIGGGGRQ